MDEAFLRIKQELHDLKQSMQRSSAAVATKAHNTSVRISTVPDTPSSAGSATLRLKNLSGSPMIFDVSLQIERLGQLLPPNGRVFYAFWVDETDLLSYFLKITVAVYENNFSGTFTIPLTITATSDFEIEEVG